MRSQSASLHLVILGKGGYTSQKHASSLFGLKEASAIWSREQVGVSFACLDTLTLATLHRRACFSNYLQELALLQLSLQPLMPTMREINCLLDKII
eukprot:3169766-Amphidinium_carterae.2